LLQTELAYWEHSFPSAAPPGAPLVLGTPIDRATLAIGAPVMFEPPIDAPVMLGDVLFDLPVSGTSDVARDVVIRRRAFDGTATVVHTGRGFGVATCTRGDGFVIAYTREGGALSLVSVRDDGASDFAIGETTVEAFAFDPLAIACSDHAAHVALVVPTGVALVDVTTGQVKLTVEGVRPPMVVSRDGSALVAARTTDRMLVAATAAGVTPLDRIVAKSGAPPARIGDLAMFELEAALVVVDVGRGTVGTVIPAIRMTMYPYEMVAWRDRFIVQLSTCCETDYEDHIEQLLLVDATTATPLPLPSSRYSPKLVPSGSRLYVRSYDTNTDDAQARLSAIDPAARALLSEEPLPLCDETAVLEERGCR
jgi:hypothetical protein